MDEELLRRTIDALRDGALSMEALEEKSHTVSDRLPEIRDLIKELEELEISYRAGR